MKLTIAVTGMNGRADNPGPGIAVARCLKEAAGFEVRIVGLGYEALDPGLYLDDLIDAAWLLPYPSHGEEAFLARLTAIHAEEKIDVIIPCLDAELPVFVRIAPALSDLGIRHFLPSRDQLLLRGKDQLPALAERTGLLAPATKAIYTPEFFYQAEAAGFRFPLVVKGLFYDAKVAHNAVDAIAAFHHIAHDWGMPVLVQQFLTGEEVNLAGVGDGKGGLAGAVMMKKRALTEKGKAWAGVSIDDPELLAAAQTLCEATHWQGGFELEMLCDAEGRHHLIEINPRFPAWIYFSAGVGRNLPEQLVKLALDQKAPPLPPAEAGMMFIRYAMEVMVPLSQFEAVTMHARRLS